MLLQATRKIGHIFLHSTLISLKMFLLEYTWIELEVFLYMVSSLERFFENANSISSPFFKKKILVYEIHNTFRLLGITIAFPGHCASRLGHCASTLLRRLYLTRRSGLQLLLQSRNKDKGFLKRKQRIGCFNFLILCATFKNWGFLFL